MGPAGPPGSPPGSAPRPLHGAVVFCDVVTDECGFKQQVGLAFRPRLEALGAKVVPLLRDAVTHVVFKAGTPRHWDRAKARGIPLVSPLWVDACHRANTRVPEANFEARAPPLPTAGKKRSASTALGDHREGAEETVKRRASVAGAVRPKRPSISRARVPPTTETLVMSPAPSPPPLLPETTGPQPPPS
eukprot:EG_transcript_34567